MSAVEPVTEESVEAPDSKDATSEQYDSTRPLTLPPTYAASQASNDSKSEPVRDKAEATEPAAAVSLEGQTEGKRRKIRKLYVAIAIISLVVIIAVIIGAVYGSRRSQQEEVEHESLIAPDPKGGIEWFGFDDEAGFAED